MFNLIIFHVLRVYRLELRKNIRDHRHIPPVVGRCFMVSRNESWPGEFWDRLPLNAQCVSSFLPASQSGQKGKRKNRVYTLTWTCQRSCFFAYVFIFVVRSRWRSRGIVVG